MSEVTGCSFDGCTRPGKSRGLCNGHYEQRRLGRAPAPLRKVVTGTLEERVAQSIEKQPDGCWIWTGHLNDQGYGLISIKNREMRAHRVAYEMAKGPIPRGRVLDHSCHNHACVNPEHTAPVTQKMNMENLAGAHRDSATGIRGVSWSKRRQKWVVQVRSGGRSFVKHCDSIEDAERLAIEKRKEMFTNNLQIGVNREHAEVSHDLRRVLARCGCAEGRQGVPVPPSADDDPIGRSDPRAGPRHGRHVGARGAPDAPPVVPGRVPRRPRRRGRPVHGPWLV